MIDLLQTILPGLIPALIGGVAGIRFVREGERAIMLRFDKAVRRHDKTYKVIEPGLKLMFPGVHKLARIHVKQRTINLPAQTLMLEDNTIFNISAVIVCRVRDTAQDLYNALFETDGIETALTDYGLIVIRRTLAGKGHEDLIKRREMMSDQMTELLAAKADEWGVKIITFELSDCEPSATTAQLAQTSAQADFRADALETAAKKLGYSSVRDLPASLAAVLVGAPLVASTSIDAIASQDDDE